LKPNSTTIFDSLNRIMLLVISLILLQACGMLSHHSGPTDTGNQGRIFTVASTPTGATVRANGNKLGVTPLEVDIAKSFSRGWVRGEEYGVVYRINGALTLEKSGCSEYSIPVSETAPSDDISITLVCTETEQTTSSSEPANSSTSETPDEMNSGESVISTESEEPDNVGQRLKKLEKLYQDGAISTDEYKQHRSRILGEL